MNNTTQNSILENTGTDTEALERRLKINDLRFILEAFERNFEKATKLNPDFLTKTQIMKVSFLKGVEYSQEQSFTSEDMYKYAIYHLHNQNVLSPKEWKERQ